MLAASMHWLAIIVTVVIAVIGAIYALWRRRQGLLPNVKATLNVSRSRMEIIVTNSDRATGSKVAWAGAVRKRSRKSNAVPVGHVVWPPDHFEPAAEGGEKHSAVKDVDLPAGDRLVAVIDAPDGYSFGDNVKAKVALADRHARVVKPEHDPSRSMDGEATVLPRPCASKN